jgi:hypothetical protein
MYLLEILIECGFDVSQIEAPSFSLWPEPGWMSERAILDPFFTDWISLNLRISPGKLML